MSRCLALLVSFSFFFFFIAVYLGSRYSNREFSPGRAQTRKITKTRKRRNENEGERECGARLPLLTSLNKSYSASRDRSRRVSCATIYTLQRPRSVNNREARTRARVSFSVIEGGDHRFIANEERRSWYYERLTRVSVRSFIFFVRLLFALAWRTVCELYL